MIVVDSSVWIDNIQNADNDQVRLLRSLDAREILLGDLVLLEVLQGARDDRHARNLIRELGKFPSATLSDQDLAIAAAQNFRRLRAIGITIRRTIDVIIATFCIENDHALLHRDRDFEPFERHLGLTVVGLKN